MHIAVSVEVTTNPRAVLADLTDLLANLLTVKNVQVS